LPASGNFIYTESDEDDWIGQGKRYTYTELNSLLTVTASGSTIKLAANAVERWSGVISVPNTLGGLRTGLFTEVKGVGRDPAKGELDWGGEARGCGNLSGWVSIDKLTMSGDVLTEVDLRFEQRCTGITTGATRARVHWTLANVNAIPPASPSPIPPGLWRADPTAVPAAGSYVYLSGAADAKGIVQDRLYTRSNAVLWMSNYAGTINLDVEGDQDWRGDFATMDALRQLKVGYYPNMTSFHRRNPLFGGLSWSGEATSCGTSGWFVVDSVEYTGTELTALDLRFEQECARGAGPVHGQIRWRAGETPIIAGPASTPPANLWKPPASFQAPAGNYAYLFSDTGNYQARFDKTVPIDSLYHFPPGYSDGLVTVRAGGHHILFRAMEGMRKLVPGYYAGLRYRNSNPTIGSFNMDPDPGCLEEESWVVVEQASYVQDELVALDLRFESLCLPQQDKTNGFIHWVKPAAFTQ
jgi:hypothetical protein